MSFVSESRQRSSPILPLASLVDILFLLLVAFLTTSTLRERELQIAVDLPAAETSQVPVSPGTQIIITFDADDRVFLGERELTLPALRQTLTELARISPNESVVVRGDRGGSWDLGVRLMDLAHAAGLRDVNLATIRTLEDLP